MADVVDADELLRRIRAARDWAAEQEVRHLSLKNDAEFATGDERAAASVSRAAYEAVRRALDEVISPGSGCSEGVRPGSGHTADDEP
ncbi:hypothetical protein [Streptomyces tsukubensis]|uniref:Uncharacterized protein n=1 Tax=Streptomyces tsukubensis TaxID=83656 RepID=A0A1V4A081_9ACTN|nr:hypothetical protein [Streptomyces tsukubensis]OON71700.1 hypothetical protein B1H18_32795 [Streptomyces tsukubensis]QFR96059.1 hypothetical protein GBW32_27195 [Streptomyces tsukubensis]